MSNGSMKFEWMAEQVELLAARKHYKLQTFEDWKAERDERLRAERQKKKDAEAGGSILYIVHGYTMPKNATSSVQQFYRLPDEVTFLLVTPDEDAAIACAIAHSKNRTTLTAPAPIRYDSTSITKTIDGVATGNIIRY